MPTSNPSAAVDSNDLVMSFSPETAWGGTLAATFFQDIRLESEGFSSSKSRTRPNEIDPSGQASAAITTQVPTTGSLNFSVSAGIGMLPLLAASIGGTFSGEIIHSTVTASNMTVSLRNTTARTCTLTVTAGTFDTGTKKLFAGQYISVVMAGTNTFTAKILTVAATVLTLGECSGIYENAVNSAATSTITSLGAFMLADGAAVSTISFESNGGALTVTGALFNTAGSSSKLTVGQMIRVYSAGSSEMRFTARVNTINSNTQVTLDSVFPSVTRVNSVLAAGDVTIRGMFVRNDTSDNTFLFQKVLKREATQYVSQDGYILKYPGSFPTGGSIDVGVGGYLQGTMAFLCKEETSTVGELLGYVHAPVSTGNVIDSVKGIGTVFRGSGEIIMYPSPSDAKFQKIGIKWNKEGAAAQQAIGTSASIGIRSGKLLVTGTMSTYFNDYTLYYQFASEQGGPLFFVSLDKLVSEATVKGYAFTFCNATIMNPKIVAGGPGQDVMADFEIEGNPDTTTSNLYNGKTFQIDYFV